MGVLRYASAGPDRLWDAIEERYFITEKRAVEKMNEKLERAARLVEASATRYISDTAQAVRSLKENV